jgi:hypothetical protein
MNYKIHNSIAEIPAVARDSIRNEGTREINYGNCISASRPDRLTPGERAPGTHWIGGWVGPEPVWTLWRRDKSCPCWESNPSRPARSWSDMNAVYSKFIFYLNFVFNFFIYVGMLLTTSSFWNLGWLVQYISAFLGPFWKQITADLLLVPAGWRPSLANLVPTLQLSLSQSQSQSYFTTDDQSVSKSAHGLIYTASERTRKKTPPHCCLRAAA